MSVCSHYKAMATESKRPVGDPKEPDARRKRLVLQIVQPGLAGLMDGSVSTLAPIFAAALATRQSHDAFLVGLAARWAPAFRCRLLKRPAMTEG
jgi:erythrin-vacuolar iron transport family protein